MSEGGWGPEGVKKLIDSIREGAGKVGVVS